MTGRAFLFLSALGLCALAAGPALPAAVLDLQEDTERGQRAPALQLAQGRDVDIFYDSRGRRVILDAYTGELIAVERPRGRDRRPLGVLPRESDLPGADAWFDRPDAIERYRRYREYQLGLREPPEDLRYLDDQGIFGDDPAYDVLPEPDRDTLAARPQIIERRPLDGNATGATPARPDTPSEPTAQAASAEEIARLQIVLDRAGASPGVIDGKMGSNVEKALAAHVELTGTRLRVGDADAIAAALAAGGPAFTSYTITATDAAGPYVASIPSDYGQKAKLERLGFTTVAEMLAERFHMDEAYLKAINPGARFRPGEQLKVANVGATRSGEVTRIIADKGRKQVRAYDVSGRLIAAYPATIGSSDTPSPTGSHSVERIAFNPEYTYNPKLNFRQGDNNSVLTIPPGPNGPVGTIWIALSKPTYGIHGTPEPSKIGKTNSHGCVRLTNWDAEELARMVKPGVGVEFMQ